MRKTILILLASGAAFLAETGPAAAVTGQSLEKTREICARATAAAERELKIPAHLLGAIALAETGRWDDVRRASFAWPWTVMAEGKGRYYDSKAEAVAAVRKLVARGKTNIDVGCMQVNLYYHGGAFANLEEAFDPSANAAYAGTYLRNLFGAAGSWTQAAAYYHSMTPELSDDYKKKVVGLWRETRRMAAATPAPATPADDGLDDEAAFAATEAAANRPAVQTAAYHPFVSPDMDRTARLNANRRAALERERALGFAERRAKQLASWREAQAAELPLRHTAIMQRARAAANRARAVAEREASRAEAFAERRMEQLRRWRLNQNPGEVVASGT